MEELLECSICMENFDSSLPRTPKMLPCQHSFCFQCIKQMHEAYRVTCPTCRESFIMKLDNIPNSLILLQLMDIYNRCRANESTCQKCQQGKKDMSVLCQDCLDAVIGNEVGQVVEIMQSRGDSEMPSIRRRKMDTKVCVAKLKSRRSNFDLYSYMRTITILLVIFSCIVVCFKSSSFYATVRRHLRVALVKSTTYALKIVYGSLTILNDVIPVICGAISHFFVRFFHNLLTCLSIIVWFLTKLVGPVVAETLSQALRIFVRILGVVVDLFVRICAALLDAAAKAVIQ